MSGSQDAKNQRQAREAALAYSPGQDGLWNWGALANAVDYGNGVPVGAKFKAPTSMSDLYIMNLGGGASPEGGSVGLDEFLKKNNLSLSQYQQIYGGLPFIFNDDGTATYDPSAQRNSFTYVPEKTFMDYAGPLMFAAIGGAGLAGLGGAGAAGTELAAGGAMDMGVGLGGSLGSWGGITPLAEGGLGSFLSEIPLGNFSNALEGGVNFADSFAANPWESVLNPSNINLSSGGFNSIDQIINSIASGGAQTFGSVGAGGALGSMLGTAPLAGIGGSSIWDTLSKVLNLGSNSSGSNPLTQIGQFGGSLLEYLQSKGVGKDLASALASATERGDPFGSQRPFYQNELKNSYSDPNYFNNSPVFKGMRDTIINDVGRTMSAQGYSGSPNTLYEIADRLQKTGMNYATQFQGQLAQNAGAGISPGTSATIQAQGANTVAQAQKQTNGAMGATLANLPNLIQGIQGLI